MKEAKMEASGSEENGGGADRKKRHFRSRITNVVPSNTSVSKTGRCDELDGYYFDVVQSRNSDIYLRGVEEMARYVGSLYRSATKIIIEKGKLLKKKIK